MSELNSLETTNDEQPGVVDQAESHDDFAMVETSDGRTDVVDQEGGSEEEPKRQTKEDNHAAAAARRQAERAAKADIERAKKEALAEFDNALKASGVKNPYTDKAFESLEEFKAYGTRLKEAEQRERAEEEGKSFEEIQREDADRAYLEQKRHEESLKADNDKKEEERQAFIKADIADFVEKYPDVDVANVVTNKSFIRFAGSRFEKEPLADLYADYAELVGEAEANGRAKDSRGARSTGSGSDAGALLTASQKRDLEAWNRDNPDMKMTAKEFLSR